LKWLGAAAGSPSSGWFESVVWLVIIPGHAVQSSPDEAAAFEFVLQAWIALNPL
jgi:hypothetical protein